MQEIGPKMTLRLKKFYQGDEEKVEGVEFEARDNMYIDRKAVYLWIYIPMIASIKHVYSNYPPILTINSEWSLTFQVWALGYSKTRIFLKHFLEFLLPIIIFEKGKRRMSLG